MYMKMYNIKLMSNYIIWSNTVKLQLNQLNKAGFQIQLAISPGTCKLTHLFNEILKLHLRGCSITIC